MKFGLIKSKIEKCLTDSYLNESFKKDIFIFNELVLNNKNLKEMYHLYDELSSNKGYGDDFANEFISESVSILKEKIKTIDRVVLEDFNLWLSEVETENIYQDIDNLVYTSTIKLEEKIKSKKTIVESLKMESDKITDIVKLPVTKIVEAANKTLENYLQTINESEREEVKKILSEDNDKLSVKYEVLKESTIDKLNDLNSSNEDSEVTTRINQTITKLNNENYNRVNYFKLKELFTNL